MGRPEATIDEEMQNWPTLTFHYGLSASDLMGMPRALRQVYAEALDGLLASQQMSQIVAAGAPYMKEADARKLMDDLSARAAGQSMRPNQITLDDFVRSGGGGGLGVTRPKAAA